MKLLKSKKSSLEMSIKTIVVVVLAMTLMGLGLTFMRGMMKNISSTTDTIQENLKQQILDDLRRGDKRLSFPGNEVKVPVNGESIIAIGVKNTYDKRLKFRIIVADQNGNVINDPSLFLWDQTEQTLDPGESRVFGIKHFALSTRGTLLYKVIIRETMVGSLASNNDYDSKGFFVNTV